MSIKTEINRISANVSDTLSAISEMGGEVPEGATSDDMASGVRSIPVGAKIDDNTPSANTTYSSQKIEAVVSELNQAIDAKGDPTDDQVSAAVNAYLDKNPVSGGIGTTAKNLLITILRGAVYSSDQSANITALETALGNGGTTEPEEKTYAISNELINCTSSNSAMSVKENASYSTTLTANDGYTLTGGTVTVTMGGVDITATTYADGVITIAAVTGDVEIFASAVQSETTPAELPTDGMLAYWDMRNAPIAETYSPTDGDSSLYRLKNNNTWEATETDVTPYGLCLINTTYGGVNIQKSTDGKFADMTFGTEFTIAAYCYGAENRANMGVVGTVRNSFDLPGYAIDYFKSDGTKHAANANYLKNAHVLGEYWMHSYTVSGNMALSFHKSNEELRVEGDGSTLEGFDHWVNTSFNIRSIKNYPRASLTAVVIYNRALSNGELIELYEYFRTLEVTV